MGARPPSTPIPETGHTDNDDPDLWAALEVLPDKQAPHAGLPLPGRGCPMPRSRACSAVPPTPRRRAAGRRHQEPLPYDLPQGGRTTEIFDGQSTPTPRPWPRLHQRLERRRPGGRTARRGLPNPGHRRRSAAAGEDTARSGAGGVPRCRRRCPRARWPSGSARGSCTLPPSSTMPPPRSTNTCAVGAPRFDLPLDLRLAEGFRRQVVEHAA